MSDRELEMYRFAEALVVEAGRMIREQRSQQTVEMKEKACHSDIVTAQDVLIETYLTREIMAQYPEHFILSEESRCNTAVSSDGYTWIIDPIDGTFNFYQFAKYYAVSLALYNKSKPVFGLVYDVSAEVLYTGEDGGTALVNKERLIRTGAALKRLNAAVLTMSHTTMRELHTLGTDVFSLLSKARAHRYLGCASLELCKVAAGIFDIYLSTNVCVWDIAAARMVIEQSGGTFISRENPAKKGKLLVAAFYAPEVWDEVLQNCSIQVRSLFEGNKNVL